jgi:O-antigen/teichoic acid export membrane protein
MAMVTALSGAATNVILNLILIPRIGANGAAIATVASFAVVFASRAKNTRRYIKIHFRPVLLMMEIGILIMQCVVMLVEQSGILMYILEALLVGAMMLLNIKPIKELSALLINKFIKKNKKSQ